MFTVPPDPPASACSVAAAASANGKATALLCHFLPGGEGPAGVPQEQSQECAAAGAPGRCKSLVIDTLWHRVYDQRMYMHLFQINHGRVSYNWNGKDKKKTHPLGWGPKALLMIY